MSYESAISVRRTTEPSGKPARRRTSARRRTAASVVTYTILGIWTVICIAPLLWIVITSFTPQSQLYSYPPTFLPQPTVDNYSFLFQNMNYGQFLTNTVIMSVLVSLGEVVFGVMAAYAFARMRFPGRDKFFMLILTGLMIPPIVTMLPLYIMLQRVGWVDTLQGLVLPQIFSFGTCAQVIFFMRQYFRTLPRELEEAARIDGAGLFRTLWSVVLPVSFPAVATGASLSLVAAWNSLLWPLLITNTQSKYVMTVGLSSLVGQDRNANWGAIMGGTALLLLPLLVLFLVGNKYFLSAASSSGLK
jgi:multiple sugar transport system permease protein